MKTLLTLILITIGYQGRAHAQPPANPFELGITYVPLSVEQVAALSANVDIVEKRLEEALSDSKGKTLDLAIDIYTQAMKDAVIHSATNSPVTGMLMRIALNQGLALTVGVPSPDGNSYVRPGILANTSNEDLLRTILRESIEIGLKYYKSAKDQREFRYTEIPFMEFALNQVAKMRDWLDSVTEPPAEYLAARSALVCFMAVAGNSSNLMMNKYAAELVEVDSKLKNIYLESIPEANLLKETNRSLRGYLQKLQGKLERTVGSGR